MNREADREHLPPRGHRAAAALVAVLIGLVTWTVLGGIFGAVSTLIVTSLGHRGWVAGDAPVALDVPGFW